ncbi:MAG: sulfotransferase [Thalassobaculaceae bacterium]|nr:sulfotransferase [Thalassobaculaceae bacterium]
MTEQGLPDWAHEMRERDRPIFIAAAAARSGTTALHRLLNAHPDVMLHGEDPIMFDMAHICASRVIRFVQGREQYETLRRNARQQGGDEWLDVFLPQPDVLMQNAFLMFYLAARPFREDARQFGKSRWGMKKPNVGAHQVSGLSVLLRNARVIYQIRELEGVLRSGKSFYVPRGEYQPVEICRQWAARTGAWAKQIRTEQHFTLNYADLDQRPEWVVEQLSAFLELEGLTPEVLRSKVNTRKSDDPATYVAPEQLTDEELDLVRRTEAALQADLAGTALPPSGVG